MTQTMSTDAFLAVLKCQEKTSDILEARINELQNQRDEIPVDAENYWERFDDLSVQIRNLLQTLTTIHDIWSTTDWWNEKTA